MYAVDFKYDGALLSDYGFMICDFDNKSGVNSASVGYKIKFNKNKIGNGRRHVLVNSCYDETLSVTFDICKDPFIFDPSDREITDREYGDIVRWLNRKEFLPFMFMYDDTREKPCIFNSSFNLEKITIGEKVYGIRLIMETDAPYGFSIPVTYTYAQSLQHDKSITISDESDEIGYIYPDIEIRCLESGDLSISNSMYESEKMIVKGCSVGEIIRVYGEPQIIQSSLSAHKICTDFNYNFLKIGNTFSRKDNIITASIGCDITLKYSPIVKNYI